MNTIKFKDTELAFNNEVAIYGYPDSMTIKFHDLSRSIRPKSRLELIKLRNYLDECIDNWIDEYE